MTLLLLRTLPWRAFGLAAAAAFVLVAVRPEPAMARLAGLLLALAAALFCDDPGESLGDATPTPRAVRRGLRWVVAGVATYAAWAALLAFTDGADVPALAAELALLLALSLAAGTVCGGPGAAPAVLVLLLAANQLAAHAGEPRYLREAAFAASFAVLAAALRDPAARRRERAPVAT